MEVECDRESYRKPRRGVAWMLREKVTEKGKEVKWCREYIGEVTEEEEEEEEKYHWEDGVPYAFLGGMHEMTLREQCEYNKKIAESEGYDVECSFYGSFINGGIEEILMTDGYRRLLNEMATLALDKYNQEQATQLVLKEVQKANKGYCDGLKHYITFDVVDPDDQDASRIKIFQAQVVVLIGQDGYRVDQVRHKPTAGSSHRVMPKPSVSAAAVEEYVRQLGWESLIH